MNERVQESGITPIITMMLKKKLSSAILSISGITIRENGEPGKGARFEMVVPKGAWRTGGNST